MMEQSIPLREPTELLTKPEKVTASQQQPFSTWLHFIDVMVVCVEMLHVLIGVMVSEVLSLPVEGVMMEQSINLREPTELLTKADDIMSQRHEQSFHMGLFY